MENTDEFLNYFLTSKVIIEPDIFINEFLGYEFTHNTEKEGTVYKIIYNEYRVIVTWDEDGIAVFYDYSKISAIEYILEGYWLVKNPENGQIIDFSGFKYLLPE